VIPCDPLPRYACHHRQAGAEDGHLRRARRRPRLRDLLPQHRPELRLLLALPRTAGPAGRGAGGAERGGQRRSGSFGSRGSGDGARVVRYAVTSPEVVAWGAAGRRRLFLSGRVGQSPDAPRGDSSHRRRYCTRVVPTIQELNRALPDGIQVIREIFWGGQRIVYEATSSGDRCVLKLAPEDGRARGEREVAIGCTFDHPNLSTVLDQELRELAVNSEKYVYFTERLIEGESLAVRTDPMEPCEALLLAHDLISAVAYLWERHTVVHRDIKPRNIMARPDGSFVLLDIGVARHQGRTTLTLVAGEHQPGTPGYLAPEQLAPLKGRELDYRADLFSIGIVLFEQLTRELPFDPSGQSYRTLLMTGLAPELPEDFPAPLVELVQRLLAPRPHGRFRLDKAIAAVSRVKKELGCS